MSDYGTRKRNNRCRNKVCACTGECFVDDGTGDFAKKPEITPRQKLRNLQNALVEDILEMSDEEIMAEAIEELGSPEAVSAEAERIRNLCLNAINQKAPAMTNTEHRTALMDLYDDLYRAAEEAIPFINRHPYGQPVSGELRRCMQAIVRYKLDHPELAAHPHPQQREANAMALLKETEWSWMQDDELDEVPTCFFCCKGREEGHAPNCRYLLATKAKAMPAEKAAGEEQVSTKGDAATRKDADGLSPLLTPPPVHDSDCATHNEPAMPKGQCDCSLSAPSSPQVDIKATAWNLTPTTGDSND